MISNVPHHHIALDRKADRGVGVGLERAFPRLIPAPEDVLGHVWLCGWVVG